MKTPILIALFALSVPTTLAQLPRYLRDMPVGIVPLLTQNNLLDLLDTYEAHGTTPIRNQLGDLVTVDTLSDRYCRLTLSPSTTVTFHLSDDGTHILQTITTTATELDSITACIRRTYTTLWQPAD